MIFEVYSTNPVLHIYRLPGEFIKITIIRRIDYILVQVTSRSLRKSANIGLSETAVLDIMAANLHQQRAINEQLRREADIPRISVSEACTILIKYMSDHENEDCLLSGFTSQKVNPFREKNACSIL